MYNLKKVIASICVIAMMLTTVAFAATYSDVETGSAYYEAVETLNKLGIVTGYEDGTYKPEDGVTRAEMAALIARIQGYGDMTAAQTATSFTDVPQTHWASGYVESAAGLKIINGYGDGNFGPEDPVLFEQAVKMVMATLGYTPYAEYNGGYPGGYMTAAQRYNVLNGVSNATMGTNANRGTIAQLLANAIDTPLMKQARWSTSGDVEYVVCDGLTAGYTYATLMSENLGVVKLRGVVKTNALTAVDDKSKAIDLEKEPTVIVDILDNYDTSNKDFLYDEKNGFANAPNEFLVGDTDIADYLGKSVIAYVTEVDDEWTVLSVAEDTTRNEMVEMDLTQFNRIDYADGKFEYYKSADAKTATSLKIDTAAKKKITVNGVETTTWDPSVVYNNVGGYKLSEVFGVKVLNNGATLDGGKITLIDNNDTNGYDVIFIEVAETAVVDEAEEGYVAFKESTGRNQFIDLAVDEDDTDRVVKVTKDGEEIALADLAEWDVLSILSAEADSDYILAEVVSNKVVGTISSESKSTTSHGNVAYKIDGTKYDVAANAFGMTGVAVGDGGTFYIDKYGKIAAFDEDAALASGVAANYAYVTRVAFDEDILTGQATAIVQMVTEDGVVALNVKTTGAKLNGSNISKLEYQDTDNDPNTDAVLTGGVNTAGQFIGTIANSMVKYTKNASNYITNITQFDAEPNDFTGSMTGSTTADQEFDEDDNKVGRAYIDADAKIFFIDPQDAADSFVGTIADLVDGEKYKVLGKYADKKAEDNNVIIIESAIGNAGRKSGLAVITSVGTSENEDGETILSIEAFANGETIVADTTADVHDNANVNALTEGDVVKIKLNADGVITALDVVYNFVDGVRNNGRALANLGMNVTPAYTGDGVDEFILGGKVTGYRDSAKMVYFNGNTTTGYKLSQASNIIVIDPNGRKLDVKRGSASSFKAYKVLYDDAVNNYEVDIDGTLYDFESKANAQNATDYVYIRVYDEKVVDVIIVKGPEKVTIREDVNGANPPANN